MKRQCLIAGIVMVIVITGVPKAGAGTVTYLVTFDGTWSESTHPDAFPDDAHFSPIIGATHNSDVAFWEPGELATPGIESMAETGGITLLTNEINVAITNGDADAVVNGGPMLFAPGMRTFEMEVDSDFPLVTLVTMIAPSPDWFVGINGLNLRGAPGATTWLSDVEVDLVPWDAGTDSGEMFDSPNQNTVPPEAIRRLDTLQGSVFSGTPPLGTIRFSLVPEPSSSLLMLLGLLPLAWHRRTSRPTRATP